MQKAAKKKKGTVAHRKVKASTVKNRKNVRRPNKVQKRNIKVIDRDAINVEKPAKKLQNKKQIKILPIEETKTEQIVTKVETGQVVAKAEAEQVAAKAETEAQVELPQADLTRVHEQMRERTEPKAEPEKISAKEIKEQAIQKAIATAERSTTRETKQAKKAQKFQLGWGRMVLALSCAAAVVFAIVYFVNLSAPDLSLRVAAMQTGIEASYPSYVPRDFSLSDITSESGKITMNFVNHSTGDSFTLTEEKKAWDSNALLENFVRPEYGEDYAMVRENGLTLYISGSDAAWVNGGTVFTLDTTSGSLTKKQIRAIAVSL